MPINSAPRKKAQKDKNPKD